MLSVYEFHILLACEQFLLVLLLEMLENLVPSDFILILALLEVSLFLRLDLSQSLCRLFLTFMQILQRTFPIKYFFSCQMHFDTLNFFINCLLIVLSPRLHLLFEELFSCLLNFLKVIIKIFVKHAPVEVIKNSKFDCSHCLQSISLSFLLFNIQQVNWLSIWAWYLGQKRKSTAINISELFYTYTVVLFII